MQSRAEGAPAQASALRGLAAEGLLSASALERALALAGATPSAARWRALADRALLALGVALCLAGVVFFFAYNWAELPRLARLGLVAAALVACMALAARLGLDRASGRAALLAAALLVGVLQAVYGQVYQIGADSHQLFFGWAWLIFGWVVVGAQAPLWLLLVVLLNLGLGAYLSVGTAGQGELQLALFGLNAAALAAWEYARWRGVSWLQARWPLRLIACAALANITQATVQRIFLLGQPAGLLDLAPALLAGAAAAAAHLYARRVRDLLILTLVALALIVVVSAGMVRVAYETVDTLDGVWVAATVVGLAIIGQVVLAYRWLAALAEQPAELGPGEAAVGHV